MGWYVEVMYGTIGCVCVELRSCFYQKVINKSAPYNRCICIGSNQ